MRDRVLLFAVVAGGLTLAGGVAFAANEISCPGGLCNGTPGNDRMTGTPETDYIYAAGGRDTLRGLGDFDDLRGGPGDDDLDAGKGSDQYGVYDVDWGRDRISGDAGGSEDWLIFHSSASPPLTVDLVPSRKRPEVSSGANTIDLAGGVVIERVQAGPADDTVRGGPAANYLSGAGGGDLLVGRAGNDRLQGDITVFSNVGADTLKGGAGRDLLDGGPGNDDLLGEDDDDELSDTNGPLTSHPSDFDVAFGGPGRDTINVQDGDSLDVVCTGPGADPAPTVDSGDQVDASSCQ